MSDPSPPMQVTHGMHRPVLCMLACLVCLGLAGCGPRLIRLPTDPGVPFPEFAVVHAQVSAACAGARTLVTVLNLSGRAGGERLRGRVHAGFARPASIRLEAEAPFGPPVFILTARNGEAMLLLEREGRVVLDAAPEEMLGALTGVTLAPADLLAVLTGCVVAGPRAIGGRLHANGWASIALDDDATLYLQRQRDRWEIRAAERQGWRIEYSDWAGGFPRSVRLQTDEPQVNLSASLAQLEVNIDIPAEAFEITIPAGAFPLSLEELRAAGPLRADEE